MRALVGLGLGLSLHSNNRFGYIFQTLVLARLGLLDDEIVHPGRVKELHQASSIKQQARANKKGY